METDEVIEHQEEGQEVTPDQVLEGMDVGEGVETKEQEEKLVPLSALQKERKKRQDAEMQNDWHMQQQRIIMQQQQAQAKPEEVDESEYENLTRAEYKKSEQQTRKSVLRDMKEELWMDNNPEKKSFIDQNLPQFLKQRPNLALAIDSASNRYKEAYELMDALTLKQKRQVEKPLKRSEAPNSPSSVPKSVVTNEAVDVMKMSDSDFLLWRKGQSKRR